MLPNQNAYHAPDKANACKIVRKTLLERTEFEFNEENDGYTLYPFQWNQLTYVLRLLNVIEGKKTNSYNHAIMITSRRITINQGAIRM